MSTTAETRDDHGPASACKRGLYGPEHDAPRRIQLRRVKGWRKPKGAVKVDRSTKWGNPFKPGEPSAYAGGRKIEDRRHSFSIYHAAAPMNEALVEMARAELAGKDLACWCRLCERHADGLPVGEVCHDCADCHADVLLALANSTASEAV